MSAEQSLELNSYKPSRIELPRTPKFIQVEGYDAIECISSKDLYKLIEKFGKHIAPFWQRVDTVFINDIGGRPFADDLLELLDKKNVVHIEVHEDTSIVKSVPQYFIDHPEIPTATVDDILDKGITGGLIRQALPNTALLYCARKYGVPDQVKFTNEAHVVEIPPMWALGKGMNGDVQGDGYPKDWGRSYGGIAFKIPNS